MSTLVSAEAPPSKLVAGKYRMTRLIGRGGMGSVWEGIHTSLNTRVAVKFIDKDHADSTELRNRFVNEAKAAARLQSKHVVQVYDQGVTEEGSPYIVMEYLDGEPLDQRLDRVERMPLLDVSRILRQVCRALSKAHEAGITHRDLKPENVFLVWDSEDRTDHVKVVDFGIAKFQDTGPIASSTRTGAVLGTPHYMSPEQARGLRTVDFRSDLWSAAVIVFRCVFGRMPFDGEAVGDLLVKICVDPIPVPSEIDPTLPAALDDWFRHALERDPDKRFQSADDLSDSFARAVGAPVITRGDGPQTQAMVAARREGASPAASTPDRTVVPVTQTGSGRTAQKRSSIVVATAVGVVLGIGGIVAFARSRAPEMPAGVPSAEPAAMPVAVAPVTPVAPPVVAAVPSAPAEPVVQLASPDESDKAKKRTARAAPPRPTAPARSVPAPAKPKGASKAQADDLGY